jgi:transcriptional regulator with XRE-family HTH domain
MVRVTATHLALVVLIIAKRKERGLLQTDVARELKRSQAWVARLESGERRICVDEVFDLARVIGFDPFKALREIYSARVRFHNF